MTKFNTYNGNDLNNLFSILMIMVTIMTYVHVLLLLNHSVIIHMLGGNFLLFTINMFVLLGEEIIKRNGPTGM